MQRNRAPSSRGNMREEYAQLGSRPTLLLLRALEMPLVLIANDRPLPTVPHRHTVGHCGRITADPEITFDKQRVPIHIGPEKPS